MNKNTNRDELRGDFGSINNFCSTCDKCIAVYRRNKYMNISELTLVLDLS
jgi:hypothetical protein